MRSHDPELDSKWGTICTPTRMRAADKVTVFSVNVTNAKVDNVSTDINLNHKVTDLNISDKSLILLELCVVKPHTKKEMLTMVGVTNQTTKIGCVKWS